MKFIVKVTFVE